MPAPDPFEPPSDESARAGCLAALGWVLAGSVAKPAVALVLQYLQVRVLMLLPPMSDVSTLVAFGVISLFLGMYTVSAASWAALTRRGVFEELVSTILSAAVAGAFCATFVFPAWDRNDSRSREPVLYASTVAVFVVCVAVASAFGSLLAGVWWRWRSRSRPPANSRPGG